MIVQGLDELIAGLVDEAVLAKARAETATQKAAEAIKEAARSIVAVRTGATRDSIEVTGSGTTREVGPTTPWAPFVEFGTYKDAPQPFMGPAADRHENDLADELEKLVGEL